MDPRASIAARQLLDDPTVTHLDPGHWPTRFERLGDLDHPDRLLWRASQHNTLTKKRAETRQTSSLRTLLGAARYPRDWAWTGSLAADSYTPTTTGTRWVTAYADDPSEFADIICDDTPGLAVSVFAFDAATRAGIHTAGQDRFVAPLQAVIDCFSGTGRMPDQAYRVLGALGYDLHA